VPKINRTTEQAEATNLCPQC